MATNPAIYVRISDDREGEAKGVKRQLEDCRELVERKGWPEAIEYNDNDVGAWKRGIVRPHYQQMLADLRDGAIDAVVVYDTDRLYRQPIELEEFFHICDDAKVTELASVAGDIDLASSDGKMMARMKGAVAVKESDDKSRRIQRKAQELALDGKLGGGGTRPFGYEDDRKTIRASEAAVVIEAAQRVLAGEAVRSLCFDLNERGIRTVTGKAWAPQVLRRMLMSGRISGQREHQGAIVADAEWSGIISKRDGDRLRAILSDPARRKTGLARRYLLAGMLRCGKCGEPLVSRPRADGQRRYVCARRPESAACGKLTVVADELEGLIVEMVLYRLDGPDLARALAARNGDREDVHQRTVDEANEQLEELARAYGERQITMPELLAARTPIEDRLSRAKTALARCNGTSAVGQFIGNATALRESWADLPLSRQRAVLSAVLDHATVNAGRRGFNRFDPDRIAPAWKV
ncbi:MAG: recombinase family protein [Solirubrobacterales bacterium]